MKIVNKVVVNNKAPEDTNVLWIDTSQKNLFMRLYLFGAWKPIWCGEHDIYSGLGSFDYSFNFDFDA